jgi:hypothetical protein
MDFFERFSFLFAGELLSDFFWGIFRGNLGKIAQKLSTDFSFVRIKLNERLMV